MCGICCRSEFFFSYIRATSVGALSNDVFQRVGYLWPCGRRLFCGDFEPGTRLLTLRILRVRILNGEPLRFILNSV